MKNYTMSKLNLKDFEKDESEKIIYKWNIEDAVKAKTKKAIKKINKSDKTDKEKEEIIKNINENSRRQIEDKNKIVVRDTELIRIIRTLNLSNNNYNENGYIAIKDLVCVSVSVPIYKTIEDGIIEVNGEKLIRLLASSGNVRNKKVIFIALDLYDKAMDILLCGLPKELQHKKISKYNAYMGLPNSDTKVVTMPRIVVVKDYTLDIKGTYDVVTKYLDGHFDVDLDKEDVLENMPFDGAGVCSLEIAKQWSNDLKLNKRYKNLIQLPKSMKIKSTNLDMKKLSDINTIIPSSFQFRAIIGVKGNLYTMDIKKYISELPKDKRFITDAWGDTHKVMDDDDNLLVDAILTESQFKFKDYYDNFEEWETAFKTDLHGYHRTFNIAKWGNKKNKEKALLSYQPIQSLKLNTDEIKELCQPTIDVIRDISTNVTEFLKYRGILDEENKDRIPSYYQALIKNNNLFKDDYIQKKVQVDIKRFKENTSKGMVFMDGNYQTLTIDLVGFMEFATGQEVKGAIKANEVYSNYWLNKNKEIEKKEKITELDIIRFPHIAQEHCLVSVIQEENDWFKYITDGIIVSILDYNNQKLGSADSNGDRVLNTTSKVIINVVREQPSNCILFKEEKDEKNKRPKESISINNIKELIECDCRGMDASIGEVVNKTTILWSMAKDEEGLRDKYIKIISVIGALVIDFVKTGVKEDIPEEIIEYIEGVHKPKFLKVKYKKIEQKQNRINKNHDIFGEKNEELFSNNDCTMNRLYDHVNAELEKIELEKPKGDTDFTKLMKYKKLNIRNETYPLVVQKLIELKSEHDEITQQNSIDLEGYEYNSDKQVEKVDKYRYFYMYCKNELININNYNSAFSLE